VVNVADWERLSDAVKRVMLTDATESEAQLAFCRAISNREIRVRIYLGKFERSDFYLVPTIGVEAGLIIPAQLEPQDLDWVQSSPLRPWRDAADVSSIFPNWRQDRIEVFSADVTKALCGRRQAEGARAGRIGRRERVRDTREGTPKVPTPGRGVQKPPKRKRKSRSQRRAVAPGAPVEQEWAPAWDPLSETLRRFLAAGFSSPGAERLICRALVDGKIRCRWRAFTDDQVLSGLAPATATQIRQGLRDDPAAWRGQMEQLYPRQFMGMTLPVTSPPPQPNDLNWRESCFIETWNFGSIVVPDLRRVWLELLQADVTTLLSDNHWLRENRKESSDAEARRPIKKTKDWRETRIRRFTETQRRQRDWINFGEIAEWCSELGGSIVSDETARTSAYDKLLDDLLDGDFELSGRSRVLYLHSETVMAKMTCDRVRNLVEAFPQEVVRSAYLDHCWIPRAQFQRWLSKHNLPTSPSRFEPISATPMTSEPRTGIRNRESSSPNISTPEGIKARRGRRGPAPGAVDRYRDADRALFPEIRRIMRREGKSLYAAALKLAEADKVKGAGTAISRAKRIVKRFNAEL
jgi:hypothetical protein